MTKKKPAFKSSFRAKATLLAAIGLCLVPAGAWAGKWANQFVEFELPPQWECHLEGAEWVCQSTNDQKKRDAIIVLAAKLKGDQDSIDQYLNYLKAPKVYSSVQGQQVKSESRYAKTIQLNDQPWVDSLHADSEIPGFYTRYLATIKNDIGVLVTYSINKAKYQAYVEDFENMVKTLKVFRKPGGLNPIAQGNDSLVPAIKTPQIDGGGVFTPGTGGAPDPQPQKPKDDGLPIPLIAGAAILGFIIWKKRRNSAD